MSRTGATQAVVTDFELCLFCTTSLGIVTDARRICKGPLRQRWRRQIFRYLTTRARTLSSGQIRWYPRHRSNRPIHPPHSRTGRRKNHTNPARLAPRISTPAGEHSTRWRSTTRCLAVHVSGLSPTRARRRGDLAWPQEDRYDPAISVGCFLGSHGLFAG